MFQISLIRLVLAAWSVLGAIFAHAAEPALPPALNAQVQRILQAGTATGAVVVLVDGLGVSGARGYGTLNPATCTQTDATSNAFVALAAMRLAEGGKLDLYAALPKVVRLSAGVSPPGRCKSKVTLANLLEHTSGMASSSQQLEACPGTRTSYSSAALAVATETLEKTSQMNMANLMRREVFKPLAMHSSAWGKTSAVCFGASSANANDVTTTPLDMANLVQMFVRRGQIEAKTYLPQCAVERMGLSISAVSMPGGNTPQAIAEARYGLGLERFKAGGQQWLGYSGDQTGAQWVWGYSTQTQSAMVIKVDTPDAATLAALRAAVASHLHRDAALLTLR